MEEVGCERACSAGWEGEGAGEGDRDRETLFMPARCCVCARAPTCELSSVETVRSSIPPSSRRPDGRACGRLHVADGYTTRDLHISQTGVHAWDVHIADEARTIGSASIFALAPLALRRPLHGARGPLSGPRFARPRGPALGFEGSCDFTGGGMKSQAPVISHPMA